ncbi:MAG TPA: sigma 54-interacting transcriptional regulator [Desulfobacteraceae bacterium]|nr:sigma 54-interacting transcriptional regulator [Desulfobacteraceae bacterium]HPJ67892.1 sigma 54-interacting transcriptional regulator [Desulfobacteraceae bacterium]HPQ28774.1 sigma 54-interacting transcriptional regulator [Desulfobacteraceae bacterium]
MRRKEDAVKILNEMLGGYGFSPAVLRALRFFFRNAYESLIIVDKRGQLEFMDRGSEKLFGFSEGGAKGVNIEELLPDTILPRVLETGYPSIGTVINVKGVRKISSSYPLLKDGEVVGAIGHVLFHSLEEIERITDKMNQLKREVKTLQQNQRLKHQAIHTFESILGQSQVIQECVKMAKRIAVVKADVLITGESGTGKELFAHSIHNFSNSERPFVRVNCPAIPFELAESELFGYEKGAFSGANSSGKQGKFELADKGTIFFDEINSLPLSIQGKLLRVLQEREVERLGGSKIKMIDFRIIATSNTDLKRAVVDGKFREDLYYRITRTSIHIPPLRERKEDLPVFINHFLKIINKQFGTRFRSLSDEALDCFMRYDWPGNIRDLINVLEQASLQQWEGEEISMSCLPNELSISSSSHREPPLSTMAKKTIKKTEKMLILQALETTNGNKRKAAQFLCMPRSTFYNKLKEYGIGV